MCKKPLPCHSLHALEHNNIRDRIVASLDFTLKFRYMASGTFSTISVVALHELPILSPEIAGNGSQATCQDANVSDSPVPLGAVVGVGVWAACQNICQPCSLIRAIRSICQDRSAFAPCQSSESIIADPLNPRQHV